MQCVKIILAICNPSNPFPSFSQTPPHALPRFLSLLFPLLLYGPLRPIKAAHVHMGIGRHPLEHGQSAMGPKTKTALPSPQLPSATHRAGEEFEVGVSVRGGPP